MTRREYMQYNDILKKIEQDFQNDNRRDIYRYNGLLEAIRFFSNRLTLDQITDTAFDFVNELLTVEKCAMYLYENNRYELKKQRGIKSGLCQAIVGNLFIFPIVRIYQCSNGLYLTLFTAFIPRSP